MFRIKPPTGQRCSEGSNKPCAHQDPETSHRLRQNGVRASPVEVQVCSGLPQGQGLWVQIGYGISPLGGACHLPTIVVPELTQDWETDSWRAQTKLCAHQDPEERSSDPTRD